MATLEGWQCGSIQLENIVAEKSLEESALLTADGRTVHLKQEADERQLED